LEELRAINAQLQEENKHLKEDVQKFNLGMREMEENLQSSTRLLPLLKNKFDEYQDSLTVVMEYWDTSEIQLVHLGEKVTQMDNWQEENITRMKT
jgi:hypothetical protein